VLAVCRGMILSVMYQNPAILAAFAFFYSLTSDSLARTAVNGAPVFTAWGVTMGPMGPGVLNPDVDAESLRTLAGSAHEGEGGRFRLSRAHHAMSSPEWCSPPKIELDQVNAP